MEVWRADMEGLPGIGRGGKERWSVCTHGGVDRRRGGVAGGKSIGVEWLKGEDGKRVEGEVEFL